MEKIDLRTAKPGDRFETRDRRVVTYAGGRDSPAYPHEVEYDDGRKGRRTDSGAVERDAPRGGDLIRKLPDEAPEAAPPEDAERIDLSKAKPGDRYEAKIGEAWTVVGPCSEGMKGRGYHSSLADSRGYEFNFTVSGGFFPGSTPSRHDLTRKLPPKTPAQSRDDLAATDTPENDATALSGPHGVYDGHSSATDHLYAALVAAFAQRTDQPLSVATAKAVAAHMADALGYEPFSAKEK